MDEADAVVTILTNFKIATYVKVASLAILIYDTLLTFDQEHRYIWQRKWQFVKVLYIFSRYTTFIDTAITIYQRVDPTLVDCNGLMTFNTIFSGFGIGLSELLLMIRTYALYNSSKRILAFFVVLWLTVGGINFWAITRWTSSFDSPIQVLPPVVAASMNCYLGRASTIGLVCYLSLLAGETVIVLMTVWKGFITWWTTTRNVPFTTSPLIVAFYRDGILFYCCILPFTIVNVITLLRLPDGLLLIANTPLRVMHSILVCRLVIHVRSIADTERETIDDAVGSIRFMNNIQVSGTVESIGHRTAPATRQV